MSWASLSRGSAAPRTRPDTSDTWRDTERAPHWSNSIEWRPGRWDPIATAPRSHQLIRVRNLAGHVTERVCFWMHGAMVNGSHDLNAGTWWQNDRDAAGNLIGHRHVRDAIEWQPMRVQPSVGDFDSLMERQRAAAPTPWVPTITGHVDCGECPRISTGCYGTCDKGKR